MTTAISAIRADHRMHTSLYRDALNSALHDPTAAIDELRSLASVTPFRHLQEKCWRTLLALQDEHRWRQIGLRQFFPNGVPDDLRSYYNGDGAIVNAKII